MCFGLILCNIILYISIWHFPFIIFEKEKGTGVGPNSLFRRMFSLAYSLLDFRIESLL